MAKKTLDFNREDRATRGASACAARATSTNRQSSIINHQSLSGFAGLGKSK
jgi:hypothetical protein